MTDRKAGSRDSDKPKFLTRALLRILPRGVAGASIAGDLEEDYQKRPPGLNREIWFAAAVGRLASEFAVVAAARRISRFAQTLLDAPLGRLANAFGEDLSFALRALRRRPLYTALTLLMLSLGLGAVTTLFTILNGALIRPLPYPEPDRLMRVGTRNIDRPVTETWSMSVASFLLLDQHSQTFENLAAYTVRGYALSGIGHARSVTALQVTHDFFSVLGNQPLLGRFFLPEDDRPGATAVAVIDESLWRAVFGGRASVLGQSVDIEGVPHNIIGVVGSDWSFVTEPQVWVPYRWTSEQRSDARGHWIEGVGRLKPGISPQTGVKELESILTAPRGERPQRTSGGLPLEDWLVGERAPRRLALLGGASALLFLISCFNVAGLGLVRLEARSSELSVRSALGADRFRLMRLLLTENLLLAFTGGLLGLLIASASLSVILNQMPDWIPRSTEIAAGWEAWLFALGLALATAVAVSVIPASRYGGRLLEVSLRSVRSGSTRRQTVYRGTLVAAQIALAMVLSVEASLLLRTVVNLQNVDIGLDTENVLTFEVSLPRNDYPDRQSRLNFYDRLMEEISSIPGVTSATAQNRALLRGGGNSKIRYENSQEVSSVLVETREVTPSFFTTLGITVVQGRGLQPGDRDRGTPAVVNRAFSDHFGQGQSVLGKSFAYTSGDRTFTIVGVVNDVHEFGPDNPPRPTAYFVYGNGPWQTWGYLVFAVRTPGDPERLLGSIRERLSRLDPAIPAGDPDTLSRVASRKLGADRWTVTFLLSAFSALALVMSCLGVYGLMAYNVQVKFHEIGVRKALGASRASILSWVIGQGARLGLLGAACGLALSFLLAGTIESLLFEVRAGDPLGLAAVALLLLVTVMAATCLPASRAAKVDAVAILRQG